MPKLFGLFSFVAVLLVSAAADAQTFVRQDCRAAVGEPSDRFDDHTHRQWYQRFWDGDCSGLSLCSPGAPNWNDAVSDVMRRAPAEKRAEVLARTCQLGRLIGYEWARDNSVRRIDTRDLQGYLRQLTASADASHALDSVEESAKSKLSVR